MWMQDHLTHVLRNLYTSQETRITATYRTTDTFRIEKEVWQGCLFTPCLLNFYESYIIRYARLDVLCVGIKIAGRNIKNLWYACEDCSNDSNGKGIKEPVDEGEGEKCKRRQKTQYYENSNHNTQSHHSIANIRGKMESSDIFSLLCSKITPAIRLENEYFLAEKLWEM